MKNTGELIFKFKGKKKPTSSLKAVRRLLSCLRDLQFRLFYSVQNSSYVDEATHMRKEQSALLSLQTPSQPHAK